MPVTHGYAYQLYERRLGFEGPFDFDIHPTDLGHTFIAGEFEKVWKRLP